MMKSSILRKLCIALLIALVASTSAFARDIVADGVGNTLDEARNDALANMSMELFNVYTKSSVEMKTTDDSKTGVTESLSSEARVSVTGELIGVVFTQPRKNSNGEYSIVATIPERNRDLYVNEIKEMASSIDALYEVRNNGAYEVQYSNYTVLIDTLNRYKDYCRIASVLGVGEDSITSLKTDANLTVIQQEYIGFLIEHENDLNIKIEKLSGNDKNNLEKELDAIKQERQEAEKAIKKSKEDQRKMHREQLQEEMMAYLSASTEYEILEMTEDPEEYIQPLVKVLDEILMLKREYRAKIDVEKDNNRREAVLALDALDRTPFSRAEMNLNGEILPEALKHREAEKRLLQAEYDSMLDEILKDIDTFYGPALEEKAKVYDQLVEKINDMEFKFDSRVDKFTVNSVGYSGDKGYWEIVLTINKLRQPLKLSLVVPFEELTGRPVVESPTNFNDSNYSKKNEEYKKYKDEVESINAMLKDGKFVLEIKYYIYLKELSDIYQVDLGAVDISVGLKETSTELPPENCSVDGARQTFYRNVKSVLDFTGFNVTPYEESAKTEVEKKPVVESQQKKTTVFTDDSFSSYGSVDDTIAAMRAKAESAAAASRAKQEQEKLEKERARKAEALFGFGLSCDVGGGMKFSLAKDAFIYQTGADVSIGMRVWNFFIAGNIGADYIFAPSTVRMRSAFELGYGFLEDRDLYTFLRVSFTDVNALMFNMDVGIRYNIIGPWSITGVLNCQDNFQNLGFTVSTGVSLI